MRHILLVLVSFAICGGALAQSRDSDRRSDRFPDAQPGGTPDRFYTRPGDANPYAPVPGAPNQWANTPGAPNQWAPTPGKPSSIRQDYNRADERREERYERGTRFSGGMRETSPPYGTGAGTGARRH
jgi:hypothetical protein